MITLITFRIATLLKLRNLALCGVLAASCASATFNDNRGQPQLKTASSHPIQYYLSLPDGWTAGKKWPVVVVIESANRQFQQAATLFAESRQDGPFILVTPLVVTNGGAGYRSVPTYHYSDAVWDKIQSGPFNFDMEGITAIIQDVKKQYGGEDKYFVTGFEAGGHTVWAMLLNKPEILRAAVLVVPNFAGRWIDEAHIYNAPERVDLPIRIFHGAGDGGGTPGRSLSSQGDTAMSFAKAHGYRNVSQVAIEGRGHEAMPDEVLAYFSSLLKH